MKGKNYFYKTLVFAAIWIFVCFGVSAFSVKQAFNGDPQVWKKALGRLGMEFTNDDSFGFTFDSNEPAGTVSQAQANWSFASPEKTLKLQIVDGEVFVSSGQGSEVKVRASGSLNGGPTDQLLSVQERGNEIILRTPNDVSIENLVVSVEVPAASKAKISIQMVSGKAVVDDVQIGSLSMRSVAGDMILKARSVERADLKTINGHVEVNNQQTGLLKIVTVAGNVSVALSDASNFSFELDSTSGRVENAFSSQKEGASKIKIRTTSGDIRIFQK